MGKNPYFVLNACLIHFGPYFCGAWLPDGFRRAGAGFQAIFACARFLSMRRIIHRTRFSTGFVTVTRQLQRRFSFITAHDTSRTVREFSRYLSTICAKLAKFTNSKAFYWQIPLIRRLERRRKCRIFVPNTFQDEIVYHYHWPR